MDESSKKLIKSLNNIAHKLKVIKKRIELKKTDNEDIKQIGELLTKLKEIRGGK
tara:strand:- start:17702 stop:17863 length:162 start_codon:yes stop_codon:yes gene_type:complete